MRSLEIHKYGGTSMADAEAMKQSAQVVKSRQEPGKAMLIVVSAMSGVTSQLRDTINNSLEIGFLGVLQPDSYQTTLKEIADRHHELINQVVRHRGNNHRLHMLVYRDLQEAEGYIRAMCTLKTRSPLHFDWISSLGERFAAPIFSDHLKETGIDAVYYDASGVIVTDGNFGNANPLIRVTRDRIRESGGLASVLKDGKIVVMGGYYGAGKDGNITTFSRGGSDLTATAMGHILVPFFEPEDPISVWLYKADVAGVMSADPRIVKDAHIIPHMLYKEAAALTAVGGSVIHPRAVHHAVMSGSAKRLPFPLHVNSTIYPEAPGTVIDSQVRPDDPPVKAISVINSAVRLIVQGWGMDQPGIMSKITGMLAKEGVDIDLIGQPYSKLALDIAFRSAGPVEDLERALQEVLMEDMRGGNVDQVRAMRAGVIGVIGQGLSDPRILRRVIEGMDGQFPELREPNAYQLTTGEFEASILVNLPEKRLNQLAQSIHDSVFSEHH